MRRAVLLRRIVPPKAPVCWPSLCVRLLLEHQRDHIPVELSWWLVVLVTRILAATCKRLAALPSSFPKQQLVAGLQLFRASSQLFSWPSLDSAMRHRSSKHLFLSFSCFYSATSRSLDAFSLDALPACLVSAAVWSLSAYLGLSSSHAQQRCPPFSE